LQEQLEAVPRKIRQLIRDLKKADWEIDHISGSHRIFKHQKVGGHVSLAGKDGDDGKPYEEKNVREAIQKSQGL
jgi:predicted RNA binding protein YcfA (HicA-like mRNA interferase family)